MFGITAALLFAAPTTFAQATDSTAREFTILTATEPGQSNGIGHDAVAREFTVFASPGQEQPGGVGYDAVAREFTVLTSPEPGEPNGIGSDAVAREFTVYIPEGGGEGEGEGEGERTPIPIHLNETLEGTAAPWALNDYVLQLDPIRPANFLVQVTPADGRNWVLLGRVGAPPVFNQHEYYAQLPNNGNSPCTFAVGGIPGGTYFFSVISGATGVAATAHDYQISVIEQDRYLVGIDDNRGGNRSLVRRYINGVGFEEGMRVELRNCETGEVIREATIAVFTSTRLLIHLDLQGLDPQEVCLVVIWPDDEEMTLDQPFVVEEGEEQTADLDFELEIAPVVRAERPYTGYLNFLNPGTGTLPPQFFNLAQRGAHEPMRLSPYKSYSLEDISVIATGSSGGDIPPRINGFIPWYYISYGGGHQHGGFAANLWSYNATAINWADQKDICRPVEIDEAEWDSLWPSVTQNLGLTWQVYTENLAFWADLYRRRGFSDWYDAGRAGRMLIRRAVGLPSAEVYGRIFNRDAGLFVSLVPQDEEEAGSYSATTLDGGYFAVSDVPPGTYDIQVSGYAVIEPEPVIVWDEVGTAGIYFAVEKLGSISGHVLEAGTGEPLADVSVTAFIGADAVEIAGTDEEGYFEFPGMEAGEYRLETSVPTHLPASQSVALATAEEVADVELEVIPAPYLVGTVKDAASGALIKGAGVYAGNELDPGIGTLTESDGTYLLGPLPFGLLSVSGMKDGYIPSFDVALADAAGPINLDLVIAQGGGIQGTVTAPGGGAIEGATVLAIGLGGAGEAITDATGAFKIDSLESGFYELRAEASGFAPFLASEITVAPPGTTTANIVMAAGLTVTGAITAPGGTVIAGAVITFFGADGFLTSVSVNPDGSFEVPDLPAGTLYYTVEADGAATYFGVFDPSDTELLEIELTTHPRLSGQVFLADCSTPLASASVSLWDDAGEIAASGLADEAGQWTIIGVAPGDYTLQANSENMACEPLDVAVAESDLNGLALCAATSRLTGTITNEATGEPVAGAAVVLSSRADALAPPISLVTDTNEAGQYEFAGTPAGSYNLVVQAPPLATAAQEVAVAGADTAINLALLAGHTLSGTVLDDTTGEPILGALVSLYQDLNDEKVFLSLAISDENGIWSILGAPALPLELQFTAIGYLSESVDLPAETEDSIWDVALASTGAAILDVTVREAGTGLPLPLVSVGLRDGDRVLSIAETDATGAATVSSGGAGDYVLQVTGLWGRLEQPVELQAGVQSLEVVLPLYREKAPPIVAAADRQASLALLETVTSVGSAGSTVPRFAAQHGNKSPLPDACDPLPGGDLSKPKRLDGLPPSLRPAGQPPSCDDGEIKDLIEKINAIAKSYANEIAREPINMESKSWNLVKSLFAEAEAKCTTVQQRIDSAKATNSSCLGLCQELSRRGSEYTNLSTYFTSIGGVLSTVGRSMTVSTVEKGLTIGRAAVQAIKGLIYGITVELVWGAAQQLDTYAKLLGLSARLNLQMVSLKWAVAEAQRTLAELQWQIGDYKRWQKLADKQRGTLHALKGGYDLYKERLKEAKKQSKNKCCEEPDEPAPGMCVPPPEQCQEPQNGGGGGSGTGCCGKCGGDETVTPNDPNEKLSQEGCGPSHLVPPDEELIYTVFFENRPDASAPAQEVFVTDILDPSLDWSTLRLLEIGWGETVVPVPGDSGSWASTEYVLDYRPEVDTLWWVEVSASVDEETGLLSFVFRTLDPETQDLPADALAGFLPPNDETHRGEGKLVFAVLPKVDLPQGTVITNEAHIVFDTEDAIVTNQVFNTVTMDDLSVTVPDVLDQPAEEAEKTLAALGLNAAIYDVYSMEAPIGTVLNQEPPGEGTTQCGEAVALYVSAGEDMRFYTHTSDRDKNGRINLSELLRIVQFFNSDGLHCEEDTEDGFDPGPGDTGCDAHDNDYKPQDWHVNLSELLRCVQFFNIGGYYRCYAGETEDGFCPGLP